MLKREYKMITNEFIYHLSNHNVINYQHSHIMIILNFKESLELKHLNKYTIVSMHKNN